MRIALCLALIACGGSSKPAATTTTTPAESGRSLEDISKVVAEHKPEARKCAGAATGRVIINFKIGKDGAVEEADQGMQDDQISDPAVVACLTELVKTIKFSPSDKSTRAYHQFEFGKQ